MSSGVTVEKENQIYLIELCLPGFAQIVNLGKHPINPF